MLLFFRELSLPKTNQIPITWPWNGYTQNIQQGYVSTFESK
jgi:hypothetical protein